MAPKRVLVVDDDSETCEFLSEIFSDQGWTVTSATTPEAALADLAASDFDLVVSDLRLNARIGGIDLLKELRRTRPDVPVILISGFGSLETAVEAVREGAFDFISKPFNVAEVIATARRAVEGRERPEPRDSAGLELAENYSSSLLLGRSREMIALYKEIARVAPSRSTVLILGESGTGKELVARAVHAHSTRASRPFVAVNCGALTETLLESELFGHVRGAFTGAAGEKKGLFEEASSGTIFLDEIGETSPALQVKLLRVLQEGEIRRVGGTGPITVDVRVIAATNRDLEEEVKRGAFREDLYYRLSVVTLRVPALRERTADIPLLVAQFLKRAASSIGREPTITHDAMRHLVRYPWPGNVRELENTIEKLVLYSRDARITAEDLPAKFRETAVPPAAPTTAGGASLFEGLPTLDELERRYLLHVLEAVGGNRTRAAEVLGVDRRTLYRMAERFGIKLGE